MDNLLVLLQTMALNALQRAFPESADQSLLIPDLTQSTNEKFGHYQCNNALKIAKKLQISPRTVAERLLSCFDVNDACGKKMLEKIEIAGPGFLNITLDKTYLADSIGQIIRDPHLGAPVKAHGQRIIVEFSSPNIAKEMHVGHIRSTIIGDCLALVLEFLGHDVLRLNHIGDWGTQFGMLISHMQEMHPEELLGEKSMNLDSLMTWYKESKTRFDNDPDFKKRSQLQVVALQSGDPKALRAWKLICDISRKGFQQIYDLLDVKIVERGESFYNPFLSSIVEDLEKKGLLTLSEGAKCLFMEGFSGKEGEALPMIVQKSDGGYNYDTTDMAALKHRVEVEKATRIIIVTDAGQSLHFQMLFKAGELAGYYSPDKVRLDHVAFGVVLGPDGKKFKTRSGHTEKLIDLLLEAIKKAKDIFKERLSDVDEENLCHMAAVLGIDAVKYSDLSCHRLKDYVFSYDRMLKFEGNTAAFLLYAYVRVQGIKRKIHKEMDSLINNTQVVLDHATEVALALHLRRFGEALEHVEKELLPNRLTDYLYELAEKFHAFFRDCRVEGDQYENSRLVLCEATGRILKKGLELLGLKTLEKM